MTDDAGSTDGSAVDGEDDDLPIYQPPFGLDAVPGFCDRLVAHLSAGEPREEFTFEGVDVESSQGVWLLPLGGYDPSEDASLAPGAPVDSGLPDGGYAQVASTWSEGVRRMLREAWGEPLVRRPRLVGSEQEPEGILDYLLVTVGIPEAEMWDRGELCCVLITSWDGDRGTSMLRQILVVLPRAFALGGMSALLAPEDTVHELLMHGEHPLELRRRAWLMSALFDEGEVRVRDARVDATRCSLQARDGTTTVWIFADDGRALLLLHDPSSEFATTAAQQLLDDHAPSESEPLGDRGTLDAPSAGEAASDLEHDEAREAALREASSILVARMLDGVPEDLRELIPARAENARGEPAEHDLEFRMVDDRPVPVISGVAWFDGEQWRVPASLTEIGRQNGFGMDDFGFGAAVRRPYRLGGSFTPDDVSDPADAERRAHVEQVFAACPYPEQERPQGDDRLGYAVPSSADQIELVEHVERIADAWWERSPDSAAWNDATFRIGGRDVVDYGRVLASTIAIAERWTVDALVAWTDGLIDAMSARWGRALAMEAYDERIGADRRSPLARFMRTTGLRSAPMWWVNGHAVVLLAGVPDPDFDEHPVVIVALARADAVLDLMRGLGPWQLRRRLRTIGELAAIAAGHDALPAAQSIAWDGPPLEGSTLVPDALRGSLRTGEHRWVWHLTHTTTDGRALLMSSRVDGADARGATFAEHAARFSGVPADLLSLVIDRDPGGLYEVVTREDESDAGAEDPLARARSLPAVQAVLWLDGVDWRASDDLLRRAREVGVAEAAGTGVATANPIVTIHAEAIGVPQLQWALNAGGPLHAGMLAEPGYAAFVLDRPVRLEEAEQAVASLGDVHARALTGALHDVLDVLDALDGVRDLRYVLDAALSNPDPQHRREIALWLLGKEVDASIALSFLTPVNVLFENPTLGADDAPVLRRLLERGASADAGLTGATLGGHPLVQLARRDLDESELEPLYDALLEAMRERADDDVPALPDAVLEQLERAAASHGRSRAGLLERLRRLAEPQSA